MKLITKTLTITLLCLCFCFTAVAGKDLEKPAAFADLGNQAFHLIKIDENKSDRLQFVLNNQKVSIPLNKNSKPQNSSFIHQNIDEGHISATQGKGSLFGQMQLKDKHYILTTNKAGIWAVELPKTGLSYNDCGVDHSNQPKTEKIEISAEFKNDKVAGTVIDVLMIYDQAIRDRYPGDLLQTRVDQYFNLSNQTYANSDIDLAIRQVGLEQVGYDVDDANINARNSIQQSLNIGVGAQGFDNVPQLRNETGADLVIFLRTHNIETRGNCGIAFFPVGNNNNLDSSYGVNVMADGMSSWSICTDQLMVHEIGHNLSAGHHNWDPAQFGYPAEARGFAKLGQYGTVMGSFGTGTPDRFLEINYFSNPDIQCGGAPCGTPGQANNANVINQLKGPVSNYLDSASNAPLPEDFTLALTDIDNDGVLDRDDEFPHDSSETVDTDGDGLGNNGDAFPNDPGEQLDTDNDGIGNNEDNDDDGDGILDFDDDFPLNANEVKDSDRDGVGDIADDLVFDSDESLDSDGDGIGNNEDSDDDNDGLIDLSSDLMDILVINVGNNRILRFDAQTGLAKGIEVLPSDGIFTFQSDLVYDGNFKRLYFSSASSIKSLDIMDPYSEPEIIVSAYGTPDVGAQLNTGFPTALAVNDNSDLFYSRLRGQGIRGFSIKNNLISTYAFTFFSEFSEGENIIDIEHNNGKYYFQGQFNSVYHNTRDEFESEILGNANYSWLQDPYALVATTDGRLLHSDQARNKILITNAEDGSYEGIFADLADLGYSNPTGMDIIGGRLLVAVSDQNKILHFNLDNNEFIGELVSGFGLDQPHKMVLVPQLQDRFHKDDQKVLRPNAGGWFNLASSGRGLNIGVFNNRIQILWFTYDEQGQPIWYSAADFLNGHEFSSQLLKNTISNDGELLFETVGQVNLTFDNEREAFFEWQLGEDSGAEPLTWLQSSGEPDIADYTGLWSRPDTPGWGLAVNTNGDLTFTIAFIYDESGQPRWAISDVFSGISPLTFDMVTVFSEGLCPTCTGDISTTRVESGTMTLILDDGNSSWSSDFLWADPVPGGWPLDETEIIRISSPPTRPR